MQNWSDATWTNYGLQLAFGSMTVNNGVGLEIAESQPVIVVEEAPLQVIGLHSVMFREVKKE